MRLENDDLFVPLNDQMAALFREPGVPHVTSEDEHDTLRSGPDATPNDEQEPFSDDEEDMPLGWDDFDDMLLTPNEIRARGHVIQVGQPATKDAKLVALEDVMDELECLKEMINKKRSNGLDDGKH
jgi:hypothetical protein